MIIVIIIIMFLIMILEMIVLSDETNEIPFGLFNIVVIMSQIIGLGHFEFISCVLLCFELG